MVLLEKNKFLEELNILFNTAQSSGCVRITMKLQLLNKTSNKPKKKIEVPEEQEKYCLIRATYKNKKLSTRVSSSEVNSFQEEYCALLRNSLSNLKKTKKIKKKVMS